MRTGRLAGRRANQGLDAAENPGPDWKRGGKNRERSVIGMARTKALARDTKKARLLRLLEEHRGAVPLGLAARELYGGRNPLLEHKVIQLISAYRRKDPRFKAKVKSKRVYADIS